MLVVGSSEFIKFLSNLCKEECICVLVVLCSFVRFVARILPIYVKSASMLDMYAISFEQVREKKLECATKQHDVYVLTHQNLSRFV